MDLVGAVHRDEESRHRLGDACLREVAGIHPTEVGDLVDQLPDDRLRLLVGAADEDVAVHRTLEVLELLAAHRVEGGDHPHAGVEDRFRLLDRRAVPGPDDVPGAAADRRRERARAVDDDLAGGDVVLDGTVDVRLTGERHRDEDDVPTGRGVLVRCATHVRAAAEDLDGLARGGCALLGRARADDHVLTCAGQPERQAEALLPGPADH